MHLQLDQFAHRLQTIPPQIWVRVGVTALVTVLSVSLVRRVAQMHRAILAMLFLVVGSVFFFQWVYERNEPQFLTAAIDRIAPFFPAKDSYGQKQAGSLRHPG